MAPARSLAVVLLSVTGACAQHQQALGQPLLDFQHKASSWTRRLEGEPSQECFDKCPGTSAMKPKFDKMSADVEAMKENVTDVGAMLADTLGTILSFYCEFKTEAKCMMENAQICGMTRRLEESQPDPVAMIIPNLDCFCDVCPTLKSSYPAMMGALMDFIMEAMAISGKEPTAEETAAMDANRMKGMCLLADGMVCTQKNPAKCSNAFDASSMGMSATMNFTSQGGDAFKAGCVKSNYDTSVAAPTTEVSGARGVGPTSMALVLVGALFDMRK